VPEIFFDLMRMTMKHAPVPCSFPCVRVTGPAGGAGAAAERAVLAARP